MSELARAERAEAGLAEARELIHEYSNGKVRVDTWPRAQIWLAQPHGERAAAVLSAAIAFAEASKTWANNQSLENEGLCGQAEDALLRAVDAYLAERKET